MQASTIAKPIRMLYRDIRGEVLHLFFRWHLYNRLFEKDAATLEVLNRTAVYFFVTLRADLIDTISIAIARLLEKPRTQGSENASMPQLAGQIRDIAPDLASMLDDHIEKAKEHSKEIVHYRHKWQGHRDLDVVLKREKLGFNREDVSNTLAEMNAFVNEFETRYRDAPFIPDGALSGEEQLARSNEYDEYKVFEPVAFENTIYIGDGEKLISRLEAAEQSIAGVNFGLDEFKLVWEAWDTTTEPIESALREMFKSRGWEITGEKDLGTTLRLVQGSRMDLRVDRTQFICKRTNPSW